MADSSENVAVWEQHMRAEFELRDVDATMATMTDDPYVHHVPVMTGAVGADEVRRFYSEDFLPWWDEALAPSRDRRRREHRADGGPVRALRRDHGRGAQPAAAAGRDPDRDLRGAVSRAGSSSPAPRSAPRQSSAWASPSILPLSITTPCRRSSRWR